MAPIIEELDGRVQWFWPGLIEQWARESSVPSSVVRDGNHVRLVGQWGPLNPETGKRLITGVDMGTFATAEMAEEAGRRIARLIISWPYLDSQLES